MDKLDSEAFERFVLDYQKKAFATAYRVTGNVHDAQEAVQEAFVKAFRAQSGFRGDSAVTTWFHRIVVNSALDIIRKRSRVRLTDEIPEDARGETDRPEQGAERNEVRQVVMAAVKKLPVRQREVFILKHFDGFSIREIGNALEVAEGTVKAHLSRAVHALRRELTGYELL